MISIILGQKGSGKTKTFLDLVNKASAEEIGNVVCIEKGDRHNFDLRSTVRLIDTSDFDLDSYKVFYGFICGIISGDYDITHIFIDSVTKIANTNMDKFSSFLEYIENLSNQFNIKFTITVSADISEAPEGVKKYLIEY
ncbi:MAG: hypothetical protein GX800_11810 [Clostridiaceae bacterium]|nr:hypothetical protein [Clostridiaceae bacterium]